MPEEILAQVKEKPHNTMFLNTFAVVIVVLIFAYVFCVTFIPIPKENIRFADASLTFLLATGLGVIITWGFRSSKAQIDKEAAEHQIKLNGDNNETP